MRGEPIYIPPNMQRRLSAWLAVVTVMVEHTNPPTIAIAQEDRRKLMERAELGSHWRVWVAQYHGNQWNEHVCRDTGMRIASADEQPALGPYNAQVTTFVLGHLCAHLYSRTTGPTVDGYIGADLQRIWAVRDYDIFWPCVQPITDEQIIALAEAIPASLRPHPDFR
jgi:hypothetical protein